jgi:hypothetical protein
MFMRKTLLGAVAGSCLWLASCTPTGQFDAAKAAEFIAQVQQNVATACEFAGNIVPTASAILSLYNATAGATIAGITAAITAVACPPATPPMARGATPEPRKVNEITITFIKFK